MTGSSPVGSTNLIMTTWQRFSRFHRNGLLKDPENEIKHGVLINVLRIPRQHFWGYGYIGRCAVVAGQTLVLGELSDDECHDLAEKTATLPYGGVMGADLTTHAFASRSAELGIKFRDCEPQHIYVMRDKPILPKVEGNWRRFTKNDTELFDLFVEWSISFAKEVVPHMPIPTMSLLEERVPHFMFWEVNGKPVSFVGLMRKLPTSAAVGHGYTPPDLRGHGYVGAVTAALCEQLINKGLAVTMYLDLREPAANRCYRKLGFQRAFPAFHYYR